jgi:hypothetical protein
MNDGLLAQIEALRQDIETQTAINLVGGINTAETMALLGHWMRTKRAPTPSEAIALEKLARERWSAQVQQAVALAKREPGGLDASLSLMLGALGGKTAAKAAARPSRKRSAPGKKPRKR